MKRATVSISIAAVAACASLPAAQQNRGPVDPKYAYIVLGVGDQGRCGFRYKTLEIEAKKNGRIRFLIVNDCPTATGRITFENFVVDGQPATCVDRTRPGSVRAYDERQFQVRVDSALQERTRCRFEIHMDGQKLDPEIVIIP